MHMIAATHVGSTDLYYTQKFLHGGQLHRGLQKTHNYQNWAVDACLGNLFAQVSNIPIVQHSTSIHFEWYWDVTIYRYHSLINRACNSNGDVSIWR